MKHLSTVLRIIRAGQEGDPKNLRVYAEFLADKLETEDGEALQARYVRRAANGDYGVTLHIPESPQAPSDCTPSINCRECMFEANCDKLRGWRK